jgi:hypothetical protein
MPNEPGPKGPVLRNFRHDDAGRDLSPSARLPTPGYLHPVLAFCTADLSDQRTKGMYQSCTPG